MHSSRPCLTIHRTRVNHACPPRLLFILDVELGSEIVFHSDLATLVLHTLVETSLVARISIVHRSPKPKPQRQGSIALHLSVGVILLSARRIATFFADFLTLILGHPPLNMHRIDQRVHSLHVGSFGERRLRSFLPKCHLSSSNLRVLTSRHGFTPLP